jgi:RimJ/RimL family protein N-acetyltransferase
MVVLRPFSGNDINHLLQWIDSRASLIQWAGPTQFSYPLTRDQLEAYYEEGRCENSKRKIFTAIDNAGTPRGHIELGMIDRDLQTATLCRVLVEPESRNRGISHAMLRELLRMGFVGYALRRIDLRVYSFNAPAIRSYEKAGFVKEGMLREVVIVEDEPWDAIQMAILRTEWDALNK